MKKILALALAALMLVSMVACAKTEEKKAEEAAEAAVTEAVAEAVVTEAAAEAAVEEAVSEATVEMGIEAIEIPTVTPGVLTVATSPDFAPYEFYSINENGDYELAGFDMALAQYIADYLGLELEVIPMDFDGTLTELAAKAVDLSISGYSPDPARTDKMDFSDLYYQSTQSFVTVKDKADQFPTLESANDPKFTIGAQNGSIQWDLAQENTPNADCIALQKVTDIVAELIAGTMDGAFIETPVAETYAVNYPELAILHEVPYDEAGSAVGVSKGNAELLAGVNEAIAAAKADGSMTRFIAEANEKATGNILEGLLEG